MKLPFTVDLSGKVAVITGAGGVLCSDMAKALAQCGAKVALLGRTLSSLEVVAEAIRAEGGEAMGMGVSVVDRPALEEARKQIEDKWGGVDILINGAGGNKPQANTDDEFFSADSKSLQTFFSLDSQGIQDVFNLNFQGVLTATQVFAEKMTERPGACIVNITSMCAFRPLTKVMAYSGAKAAVSNFTQWLATHFAPCGLRVNAIAPGFFVTHQNKNLLFDAQGKPTPRTEKILRSTPMGRFGEPDELIGTLLWLVSPQAAGFVTGIVVPVDGGFSAYSGV